VQFEDVLPAFGIGRALVTAGEINIEPCAAELGHARRLLPPVRVFAYSPEPARFTISFVRVDPTLILTEQGTSKNT